MLNPGSIRRHSLIKAFFLNLCFDILLINNLKCRSSISRDVTEVEGFLGKPSRKIGTFIILLKLAKEKLCNDTKFFTVDLIELQK